MTGPISQNTYGLLTQRWAKSIVNPETFSVDIWYPIAGSNMRIKQFLLDRAQQRKYIQNQNTRLVYLDLAESQGIFAQDIVEQIGFALQIMAPVEEWLEKNQEPTTFFILGLDSSIRNGISQGIEYIQALTKKYHSLSCILFTEIDIPSFTLPLSNIAYQPLYSIDDSLQFYKYLEEKWNFQIPTNLSKKLTESLGGHFLLLKEAGRLIHANLQITLDEILTAPSMRQKGQAIFQRLSDTDQQTIRTVLEGMPATPSTYLQETGLITSRKIGIPYWNTIREELLNQSKQTNFDYVLTAPEREIFELLRERNTVVDRDTIAQTLWQKEWEEKYSDWAIDQLIHRLREKIEKTHAPFEILTKKGEGFILLKDR